jgi:hypothetical protein
MLCLSLIRPWPWTFFYPPPELQKDIENRKWKPWPAAIGKRIALHAGKTFDSEDAEYICTQLGMHPDGTPPPHWDDEGIIGTVLIPDWFESRELLKHPVPPEQERWVFGPYCWRATERRLLPAPIPCRGHQGLWDLRRELTADQVRQVEAA